MNRLRILGAIASIAVAAGLAACGGGGGGVGTGGSSAAGGAGDGGGVQLPVRVESPFASDNMLVPTGAASKSFAVSECTRYSSTNIPVNSATVVLTANGDMIFSGALGTAAVAELGRINFADTISRDVYGDAGADPYLEADYFTADGREMQLYNNSGFFSRLAGSLDFDLCNVGPTTATMTLQQPLSQARVVSNIVTGSTGTLVLSPSVASFTQTGSIVSWDSGRTGTYAKFISFNLDTAQFGQGTSLDPSTHTPVAFALPAPSSTVYGYYNEYLDRNGDKTIRFTHDNIRVEYTRYASPASGREFRFYGTSRG